MSEVKIAAEPRTEFGKGAARRVRRAHKVPAVLYGHGGAPRHISLPGHELMLALKSANVLLRLELETGSELALPKDVQRDPIRGTLEHVDLVVVRHGEKVHVEIPVHLVGEPVSGNLVNHDLNTLAVEAEATNIPTGVEVSIAGLDAGDGVHARDIELPEGVSLVTDPDAYVVHLTAAPTAAQEETTLAAPAEGETAEAGAPAEGETAEASEE